MWFSAVYRHSFQNPLLCIGKQIFSRSSGPETGEKKSASDERLVPGQRGPRSPIYVMDVVKRNGTYPSGERPPGHRGPRISTNLTDVMKKESGLQAIAPLSLPRLPGLASRPVRVDKQTSLPESPVAVSMSMPVAVKAGQMSIPGQRPPGHRGPSVMKRESGQQASAHPSLHRQPSLASQPVRVDKRTSLPESPVAVSTNKPVLDLTHVPVKPEAGQNKSAGHSFLPKAEEKTSVSGVRLPGHRGARSSKHFMNVSVKNIIYPSCESDLNDSASLYRVSNFPLREDRSTSLCQQPVAVSMSMPVPVKAGQMSISGERHPGHRGPSVMKRESGQQASAHLSLLRLPDHASQPVRVDKRTSLSESPVAASTNKLVLDRTHVPVKPEAGQNKPAGHCFLPKAEEKTLPKRLPSHREVRSPDHFIDVSVKNIIYPSCESVKAGQMSIPGERPPGHRGPWISTNLIDVMERGSGLQAIAPLSLPQLPNLASRPVRVDKRTSLCERPVSMNVSGLKITHVPVKPVADPQKRGSVALTSYQSFSASTH